MQAVIQTQENAAGHPGEARNVDAFVGSLLTTSERDEGSIVVNARSSRPRRRFTVAHELGHFLNVWHKPTDRGPGFLCTAKDVGGAWNARRGASRHELQESQANRFAIELLAPARLMRSALGGVPDLAKVVRLAENLGISREACARLYGELHPAPTAIVFSKAGVVRYCDRDQAFPYVALRQGDRVPMLPQAADASGLSAHELADWRDWLGRGGEGELVVQTLHQRDGFAITLLALEEGDD